MSPLRVTPTPSGTRIDVRVMPRSSRTAVEGVRDGRLLIRVTAPPVDRAANDAAVQAVARALDLAPGAVRIVSGHTNRNKVIEVGLPVEAVRRRLETALATR
jgi:uncharacterized protein YggU (UPF0235/DUF167 family)